MKVRDMSNKFFDAVVATCPYARNNNDGICGLAFKDLNDGDPVTVMCNIMECPLDMPEVCNND